MLCKHEVVGSIPSGSTRRLIASRLAQSSRPERNKSLRPALGSAQLSYIVKRKYIRSFRKGHRSRAGFVVDGRALQSVDVA